MIQKPKTIMETTPDIKLDIASGHSRKARRWSNRKWTWRELVERCRDPRRTSESVAEYTRMSREEQSDIKDVGGFVGGFLREGVRKTANVALRSCATLDIDYGTPDLWEDFTRAYGFAAILYSTHKHTPEKPRYRLVFPFSRPVTPEEYEPLCRRVAAQLGIEMFDHTTYELGRLFYWPSASRDGEYVFREQKGPACDPDALLATYTDFRDASSWPVSSREGDVMKREIRKAGDPTEKKGLVGAFCRTYTIEEAIGKFLPDIYEPTGQPGRYTYAKGHVAAGLVCYEGKFAYSHHETDPAGHRLNNAFDLIRIHKCGGDGEADTGEPTRQPSYRRMCDLAAEDMKVRMLLTEERRADAGADFSGMEDGETGDKVSPTAWMNDMADSLKWDKGQLASTAANIIAVLENDPRIKGHIWLDLFSGFALVRGGLPWDKNAERWGDLDDANLRVWLEREYGLTGKDRIRDAKDAVLTAHRAHPIRDYLNQLHWDGTERLDRMIIDHMGAEDNALNRAMTRKHFTAAVARVFRPGCKYDYCLILAGLEGAGKSTLFSIIAGEWFNDSLITTEGKTGMEQLRCSWIIELAELASIKRSDVEQVKNYLSRREDVYRAAYGSTVQRVPRQCVFCGSTNEDLFLKGDTGNRRFWVMRVDPSRRKEEDWAAALARDRDQLWAEAVHRFKEGEKLYLPADLEAEARDRQKAFNESADDPMREQLHLFLDRRLPDDWDLRPLASRRAWLHDFDPDQDAKGVRTRSRVCAAEFLCEQMRMEMNDRDYRFAARKFGRLMAEIDGWEKGPASRHADGLYGVQKCYDRKEENAEEYV